MKRERESDSAERASWAEMEWLVRWKNPNWAEAERRSVRRVGFWGEREMRGGEVIVVMVVGGGERRVGRERVGGRRWSRRDKTSAEAAEEGRGLGWVEGVGGGAAGVP